MTSEPFNRLGAPAGGEFRDWQPLSPARSRPFLVVGLGVTVSLALVGLSILASAFVVRTLGDGSLRGSDAQSAGASEVIAARQQSLHEQSGVIEERRAAVTAFSTKLTEFKASTARPPGALGINLGTADAQRREAELSVIVLECINAIDHYNLQATALSTTQLRSAGLPERFVWPVDCAPTQ